MNTVKKVGIELNQLTAIVMALATGAAAGTATAAESAVKDAYTAVRTLLARRFPSIGLDVLERDPGSPARQEVVKEDLASSGAAGDEEVLKHIERLLEAISKSATPSSHGTQAVDLNRVRAAQLVIKSVTAEGGNVGAFAAQDVTVGGTFWVENVEARDAASGPKD